jgi:hypothetical protein
MSIKTRATRGSRLFAGGLFGLLLASGCRSATSTSEPTGKVERAPENAPVTLNLTPSTLDSFGADSGASCSDAGPPTTGLDGGASCGATLAASTFQYAICSCGSLQSTGVLTTDGYDSTKGGPTGALGANVGFNASAAWSSGPSLGGSLFSPGGISAPKGGLLRGDLHLGGAVQGGGQTLTVDGNAFVEATLPSSVKVLGTTSHVSSVASPCNCNSSLPISSLVSAHNSPNNEDSAIGLSASAAGGGNPAQIDLPCGDFYLTVISPSKPLTIAAHGHTELYIGGAVSASSALTFSIDPGASLDLFVAGGFSATSTLNLGTDSSPASCRMYVAGSQFQVPSSASIACNIYAPSASIALPSTTAYGAIYANGVTASGSATLHYDTSIENGTCATCTPASCDDGNPCTVDSCNSNGTCSHTNATNGTSCPAGANKCDQSYTCQSGACTGSNPVTCTAEDQCHAVGTCNTSTGVCSNPALANGTTCNDGNGCTQTDSCQAGVCTGANPVTCTAEDQCHAAGTCNPANGTCSNPALANGTVCNDGNACTLSDSCQSGSCVGSNPVVCAASDPCHMAGACNPSTGACSNPVTANGTACSDGNACDLNDSCQTGVCTAASHVTCTASDQCHVAGTCNPSSGTCSNPAAANGTACNDGNACTQSDSCQSGTCTGSNPVVCTASDACHTVGTCNTTTGTCSNPTAHDGAACTGTNLCNQTYTCAGGTCTGSNPVTCVASGQCQMAGTCNPATGACSSSNAPDGTSCNDGNGCTTNDSCTGGTCAGTPVTCTATDACHTAGSCDPASGGCSNPAVPDGTSCTGANPCNQTYACLSGTCTGSNPVACTGSAPQFAATAPMTEARESHSATKLANGDVLVAGGHEQYTDSFSTAEIYHSATRTWLEVAPMNVGRAQHAAVLLPDGRVLIAGGVKVFTDAFQSSAEIYDPSRNTWTLTASMATTHQSIEGVLLGNGQVLVVGYGVDGRGCVISSEVYDPGSGLWSPVGDAAAPFACATQMVPGTDGNLVLLSNGSAIAMGDLSGTIAVYVAGSSGWVHFPAQPGIQVAFTPAALSNGKVLVAGGYDPATGNLPLNAELFDPASNTWTVTSAPLAGLAFGPPTTLPNGNIVFGQQIYVPNSGTWLAVSATPPTSSGPDWTAIGSLGILITGGSDPNTEKTLASATVFSAPDAQCTQSSTCDPVSGQCVSPLPKPDGTACSDGNLCMQTEACQGGYCVGTSPVTCTAAGSCQSSECDPLTGACVTNTAGDGALCSNGNACALDSCVAGTCTGTNSVVVCDPSDACHVAGQCVPATGMCTTPPAPDGTACTGNPCNQSYACTAGVCVGINPVLCAAADQCHGVGTCDPNSGTCSSPTLTDGTACDDSNACTQSDSCQSGTCVGSDPVVCNATGVCGAVGECQPSTGLCSEPIASDGTPCSSSNLCDQTNACVSGSCVGSNPMLCQESGPCWEAGTCDPGTGACSTSALPDGTSCDDLNACTANDKCVGGVCTGTSTCGGDAGSPARDGGAQVPDAGQPSFAQQTELQVPQVSAAALQGSTAFICSTSANGLAGACYVFTLSNGVWSLQQTLTASDGAPFDYFGTSVALDGVTAVVGAIGKGGFTGAAYVFTLGGAVWTQHQELGALDAQAGNAFGSAVALSDGTALIGASAAEQTGAAYVFAATDGTWLQQAELTASDGQPADSFGSAVALSGSTALIGAYAAGQNGAAYTFTATAEGGSWSQQQKLLAFDGAPFAQFGFSVAVSGTTAIIGANGPSANAGAGSAYLFTSPDGAWLQQQELTAANGTGGDSFGSAVALSANGALVGAPGVGQTGSAYLFTASGSVWSQQQLNAADSSGGLGTVVALDGSFAVLGANNAAYVFSTEGP